MNLSTPVPPWAKQGMEHHEIQEKLMKHRQLTRFGLDVANLTFQVRMTDLENGFHGVADAILETDSEVYPVEIKHTNFQPSTGHKLQLCAYAMLAETHFLKPSPRGFFMLGDAGQVKVLEFDTKLRIQTTNVLYKIVELLKDGTKPHSSASEAQCGQCEFLNFCNDRE